MNDIITLNNLEQNHSAVINKVDCGGNLNNRLIDLGFICGTQITYLFSSPFGDPKAYLVKNAVIALRNKDCESIYVTPIK